MLTWLGLSPLLWDSNRGHKPRKGESSIQAVLSTACPRFAQLLKGDRIGHGVQGTTGCGDDSDTFTAQSLILDLWSFIFWTLCYFLNTSIIIETNFLTQYRTTHNSGKLTPPYCCSRTCSLGLFNKTGTLDLTGNVSVQSRGV